MSKPINVAFGSTAYGPLWAPAVRSWLQTVAYTARYFAVEQRARPAVDVFIVPAEKQYMLPLPKLYDRPLL